MDETLAQTAIWEYNCMAGNVVVGTLQEIGEALISANGAYRLTDNPMPWLDVDDYGTDSPRDFTVNEWIEWASKFEDRPSRHVYMNLEQLTA